MHWLYKGTQIHSSVQLRFSAAFLLAASTQPLVISYAIAVAQSSTLSEAVKKKKKYCFGLEQLVIHNVEISN